MAWGPRVGLMPTWMKGLDAQGEFLHCCAVLIRLVSHGGPEETDVHVDERIGSQEGFLNSWLCLNIHEVQAECGCRYSAQESRA